MGICTTPRVTGSAPAQSKGVGSGILSRKVARKSNAPDGSKRYAIGIHFGTADNEIVSAITVVPVSTQSDSPNPDMFYRTEGNRTAIYSIVPPEQGGYLLVTSLAEATPGTTGTPSPVRPNTNHRSTTYFEMDDLKHLIRADRLMVGDGQTLVFWLRVEKDREIQVYPEAKDSKLAGAASTVGLNVPLTMFNKGTFANFNAPDLPRYFKVEKAGKGAVVRGSDQPFDK
jgi:hypothetical protein